MLFLVYVIRLNKSQITLLGFLYGSRKLFIVIIGLMLSLYIGPKVITLSSFHCSNVFSTLAFIVLKLEMNEKVSE
jgi:hypothetical protein